MIHHSNPMCRYYGSRHGANNQAECIDGLLVELATANAEIEQMHLRVKELFEETVFLHAKIKHDGNE